MRHFISYWLTFCVVCSAENVIRFHLIEELPTGTLVGNLAVESGLRNNLTQDELNRLRYSFLDQTNMKALFKIHETTGNLLIKTPIDSEIHCVFALQCVLKFDVAIHSSSPLLFEIYTVEITIEDKNDNSPKFSIETMDIKIHESTLIGSVFGLIEASDIDSTSKNTIQKYELAFGSDILYLNSTANLDGRFSLNLVLIKELDREKTDTFHLELLAIDGGDPIRTGTLNINVNVLDDNDNSPIFEKELYTISIEEGISRDTPILAVNAYDKDAGSNGDVIYKFSPRQYNFEKISQLFSINEQNGVISVVNSIEYEKENVYEIIIDASDRGTQPRTSSATVVITVLDTVNNKPEVLINFLISANDSFASLSEAADVGTVIAHVTVGDADSGPNGQVICAVTNDFVTLQDISGKPGYLIILQKEFDRETKQEHYISVTCSDNGSPKLSTSKSFVLQIVDENDNAPEFTQKTYSTVIDENNEPGKFCLKVSATDADIWPNDDIRYILKGNSENMFSINSVTGVITANQNLDREKQDEYRFTVLAMDNGNTALTSSAVVVIVLRDINDNRPAFDVPFFQFFIKENLNANTLVGKVIAHDSDLGKNKVTTFSLVQNQSETLPFIITSTGEIKSTKSFDREKESSHIFEIAATDQGLPPLSSTIFVRVYVTDDNDNKPLITYPNDMNSTVVVTFSPEGRTYLTTIKAKDDDEAGPNSLLTFGIISGNEDDVFSVGKSSGHIYLKRPYEVESDSVRTLTVCATDNGQPPLNTTQTFSLVLKYMYSPSVSPFVPSTSGNKNVIISIAVISMTIIISGALIGVICILRRSEQIRKKLMEDKENQKCSVPDLFKKPETNVQNDMNLQENIPYPEPLSNKGKDIHSSYDEDLDMELYNSFGTSVFTDTLPGLEKPGQSMEDQRIIKRSSLKHILSDEQISGIYSLDDISEISGEGTAVNSDSGRGSSDPDTTRTYNFYYNHRGIPEPKPEIKRHSVRFSQQQLNYEQKYYGFVDLPTISHSNSHPNDLKIGRFNEEGTFCVDMSSFV